MNLLLMALLGGLGAVARFVTDATIRARVKTALPMGTLVINAVGSFVLGLLTALVVRQGIDPDVRLVLGTGFCGGFTTFSTACVEVVRLGQSQRRGMAVAYLAATVALCLVAAVLGYLAG